MCALAFTVCDLTWWSWPSPEFADLSDRQALITLSYSVAQAAAPLFLGQLVQARRELSLRLVEVSEAREHERLLIAQSVLAKERAQLAREMHDVVSHQVSLIAVRAGALQVGSRDPEAKEAAATIRRLSVQTLDELRHMVGVLRASGSRPTELTPQPSLADLDRLVTGSGIDADLRTDLPDDLPPPVQRAVYRTVQEALTNIRKHAPGATATIRVLQRGRHRPRHRHQHRAHPPRPLPARRPPRPDRPAPAGRTPRRHGHVQASAATGATNCDWSCRVTAAPETLPGADGASHRDDQESPPARSRPRTAVAGEAVDGDRVGHGACMPLSLGCR